MCLFLLFLISYINRLFIMGSRVLILIELPTGGIMNSRKHKSLFFITLYYQIASGIPLIQWAPLWDWQYTCITKASIIMCPFNLSPFMSP